MRGMPGPSGKRGSGKVPCPAYLGTVRDGGWVPQEIKKTSKRAYLPTGVRPFIATNLRQNVTRVVGTLCVL